MTDYETCSLIAAHVSGAEAGAENAAEWARKPDEREGRGERAELATHILLNVLYNPHSAICINFQISNSNTLRKFCIELAAIVNTLGLIVVQFSFV